LNSEVHLLWRASVLKPVPEDLLKYFWTSWEGNRCVDILHWLWKGYCYQ